MREISLKDVTLVIGLITGFVAMLSFITFYTYSLLYSGNFCTCREQIPLIIILVASSGLFVGSFAYYFLIDKIVRSWKAKKDLEKSLTPFLKLLNGDEEKVVRLLLQKKKLSQASISKLAGLSRVRTTRVLQKLEDRGIVKREKKGKTNIVELAEHIMKLVE